MLPRSSASAIARALLRLQKLDPATDSPCSQGALEALREDGWDIVWREYPRASVRITGELYEAGYELIPRETP